jgi:2-succinyl-5-enolpyruvyl-6-hydroxy-3-cyclohexene-1-carboxylate synthase
MAMSSKRRGISELPYLCLNHGIDHAIISPGSRNAPLTIAFASHPDLKCFSITDERSAAYYGLGMAQELMKPVVLICTSGTAMINYAPALAEAYYLGIPLIAITADRPAEWIDQNDGQTIRQRNLYQNFVKGSFETPVETKNDEDLWHFRRIISEAINLSIQKNAGPVHINIPLREPLYEKLPSVNFPVPVIKAAQTKSILPDNQLKELKDTWNSSPKKLIICGLKKGDVLLQEQLNQLVSDKEAVVIAENLSNLHITHGIDSPDRFISFLNEQQKADFKPDLLITIGGPVLSKKLKKYLRVYRPTEHWKLGESNPLIDTFQSLTQTISIDDADFFAEMIGNNSGDTDYAEKFLALNHTANSAHQEFIDDIPFCDLAAYDLIFQNLPENINVHLANSTPVRYAQLFKSKVGVQYYSNRGTSGIDGCISTAAGTAMVSEKLNVALVGDLAFIYDSNALWNNAFPANLRIIVIDNEGGNIFRLIDTSPEIEPVRNFFETPHKVRIDKLCEAFNINYQNARTVEELSDILPYFFKPNGIAGVLHIQTSGELSANIFKKYYQFIAKNNEYIKKLDYPEGIQRDKI